MTKTPALSRISALRPSPLSGLLALAMTVVLMADERSAESSIAKSVQRTASAELVEPSLFRDIAADFAPVILQGIGSDPDLDIFTRFDFDGDLNAYNNWKNGPLFTKLPAVYYDVTESRDRYFITYGLFYPRDYDTVCTWWICHENDFEGMRITVDKTAQASDGRPGRILLLETIAHSSLKRDERPDAIDLDGRGARVAVVVESKGHGIWPHRARRPDRKMKIYGPRDYELIPINELWSTRDLVGRNKTWQKTFNFSNGRFQLNHMPSAFGGTKWGSGRAHPPWGWGIKQHNLKKGEWFLDPIASQLKYFSGASKTDEYLFSRYLTITRYAPLTPPERTARSH